MTRQHWPIPNSLDHIADYFSEKAFERGLAYSRSGKVLEYQLLRSSLSGSVKGSNGSTYSSQVSIVDGRILSTRCSCPLRADCKHCAALSIIVATATTTVPAVSSACAVIPLNKSLKALPGSLPQMTEDWIANLASALALTQDTLKQNAIARITPVGERILYLWCRSDEGKLVVETVIARALKNGGYSQPREYSFAKIMALSSANCVTDEDIEIARLITAGAGNYGFTRESVPTDPTLAEVVLKRMIATGRSHWLSHEYPALQLGDTRTGALEWQMHDNGIQSLFPRVQNSGSDSVALNSSCPWYVDESQWTAGPLSFDFPNEVVRMLLKAPPVLPAQAEQVNRRLSELLPGVKLPAPRTGIAVQYGVAPAVPVLKLTAESAYLDLRGRVTYSAKYRENQKPVVLPRAILEFDYQGVEFDVESGQCKVASGDRIQILTRDFSGENAAAERLQELGFEQIYPQYVSRFEKVNDTLRFGFPENDKNSWVRFARLHMDQLKQEGWKVEIDQSFNFKVVQPDDNAFLLQIEKEGSHWFDVQLGVEVEGKLVSLTPILMAGIRSLEGRPTVKSIEKLNVDGYFIAHLWDDRALLLPFERVRKVLEVIVELYSIDESNKVKMTKHQIAALQGWNCLCSERLKLILERLRAYTGVTATAAPASFKGTLRDYQQQGVGWLQFLQDFEFGGILADDMGLGKTVQALAHILMDREENKVKEPTLVVCPTSVVPNWVQEAQKLTPSLRVLVLRGPDRHANFARISDHDIVITTYPLLPRDCDKLTPIKWRSIFLDEAQAIKNHLTQTNQVACKLKADYRVCMTGTPVENNLGELWSLFNFLMPGLFGTRTEFRASFQRPIEEFDNQEAKERLTERLKPFLLRRTKDQVACELPKKTVMVKFFELEGDQRDLYETVRVHMLEKVRNAIATKGLVRSRIVILDAILKLRQVCCDPRLLRLPAAQNVKSSAKLFLLREMLSQLMEEGRKVLLFSQFTSMLDLIVNEVNAMNVQYVELRGTTTDRKTPVEQFQKGKVPLFMISLRAGGTGLNLTAADTVIHYDPWWNPAVEDQATDRAYRIGQDKPVFVYKLIGLGTIEEKLLEMQGRKRKFANAIYDDSSCSVDITEEDIESLFAPLAQSESSELASNDD